MQEDKISVEEDASEKQARLAAQSAVSSVQRQMELENNGRVSRFALYTWGSLAVFCTFFAATSFFIPLMNGTPGLLADKPKNDTSVVASAESEIDPLTTGTLGKTDRPGTDGRKANESAEDAKASPILEERSEDVYGVRIGVSKSVPELVERYKSFSRRAPDLFTGKRGRVRMAETNGQLQAQLIAGPFNSAESVALFCRSIRLKLTADCSVAVYGGEKIK